MFEKRIEKQAQKRAAKDMELLKRYGLENLNNQHDLISIKAILGSLTSTGRGLMEVGGLLSNDYAAATYYMLKGIFEENLIIIRQLDRLSHERSHND